MPRKGRKPEEILEQLNEEFSKEEAAPEAEELDTKTSEEEATEEKKVEAAEEAPAEETEEAKEEKPKRRRSRRKKADEGELLTAASEELPVPSTTLVATGVQESMEAMAKQWSTVRDITSGITGQLERVKALLQETKEESSPKFNGAPSSTPLQKIAVGFSALALVFSILSVVLAQSVRQSSVEHQPLARSEFQNPAPGTELAYSPDRFKIKDGRFKLHPRR